MVIKTIEDDLPEFGCAMLAMEQENVVIVLGKLVDLKTFEYEGKSLGFLCKPGGGAVLASRTMLKNALAELDAYDARQGFFPPSTDKIQATLTAEDLEEDED